MEEEGFQKKDEAFLKLTLGSSNSLSVGTITESAQSYNKSGSGDGQAVPTLSDNALTNHQGELVSLETAKTSAHGKALGAFEVLSTSSTEMPVSVKTTQVLSTVSGGVISVISTTISCGKVGQGSQKIGQVGISSVPQKPGTDEHSWVDGSTGEGECLSEDAAGKSGQGSISRKEIIDTFREKHTSSGAPKPILNSSHITDAIEISKNNNNIDKPINANNTGLDHSFVDQKECNTSSVSPQTWDQGPQSQSDKFKLYSSGNVGSLVRLSPAADAGSWLRNTKAGSKDVLSALPSYKQSVSTSTGGARGSLVLHGTSGSMFFTRTGPSSALKKPTFQNISLTEPMKSTTVSAAATAASTFPGSFPRTHRTGIDVQPAVVSVSRLELALPFTQPSAAVSTQHQAAFSSHSETQRGMERDHTKSAVANSVSRAGAEASENILTKAGNSRASAKSPIRSYGFSENKLLPSATNLPPLMGENPLSAAKQTELPQRRASTPKLTKKTHSRSPKPKFQKAAQFTADEDDDDNDFIPVGMLQLSSLKKPEDNRDTAADVRASAGEKNVGNVYQLNQGLNVIYRPLNRDQVGGAERTGDEMVTGSVQERLRHKVQQSKLKQLASVGHEHVLQLPGHKKQDQGLDTQRHQLFLQLLQHAQQGQLPDQQQRQLPDQQQRQLPDQQQRQLPDQQQKQLPDQQQRQPLDQQQRQPLDQQQRQPLDQQQRQLPDQQQRQLPDQQQRQLPDQQQRQLPDQQQRQLPDQQRRQLPDQQQRQLPDRQLSDQQQRQLPDRQLPDQQQRQLPDRQQRQLPDQQLPDQQLPDQQQRQLPDRQLPDQQQRQLPDQQQRQLPDQQQKQLPDRQLPDRQLSDQQQRQLSDQQQRQLSNQKEHLHQSTLSPADSAQSRSPVYLKNLGLVIHQSQSDDVQNMDQQNVVKGPNIMSEQSGGRHFLQEQFAEGNFKNPEMGSSGEKSHRQAQRDAKYPGQLQQETTALQQESPWQVQSSNIPKIAERLLQQSLNEQLMQQGRQVMSHSKSEQLLHSLSHVSVTRSDPRPMTPASSSHHSLPSLNQQHPEIARMLSSPVSPRQPASPRQAASPRGTVSPIQLSATSSSQFSHPHLVSPSPRKSVAGLHQPESPRKSVAGLHQPASSKSEGSMNSQDLYLSASLKQAGSSQQGSDSRQLHLSAPSSTDIEQRVGSVHAPRTNEQCVPMQFPESQRKFEQARVDLFQPLTSHLEKPPQYPQNRQQIEGRIHVTSERQQLVADVSITLPNNNTHQLNPSQTIPFSQSFRPGQIIHYRPPEKKNTPSKVSTVQKSQPSPMLQLPSPAVSLTKLPTPLTQTAGSDWQSASGQAESEMTIDLPKPLSFHSSEPADIKRANKFQTLQGKEPAERKQLAQNSVESQLSPVGVRERLPASLSVPTTSPSSHLAKCGEGQLRPASIPCVQPTSTNADIKSESSYMSTTHSRHFQTIASLTVKEANFLQSLFANVEMDERMQRHPLPESHPVPQMTESFVFQLEETKGSSVVSERHIRSPILYPEVRKNEGGLKVLSEIASKCYALDVAGKEEEEDQQASCTSAGDTAQKVSTALLATPPAAHQIEQAAALKSTVVSVSDTEPLVSNQNQSVAAQEKTNQSFDAKGDNSNAQAEVKDGETKDSSGRETKDSSGRETKDSSGRETKDSSGRETKESSMTQGETPRREVRQRKPKKPFEQEEAPVKRLSKLSPQKILPGRKQTQTAPAQSLTQKRGHNHRERTAGIKLKEEIDKEDNRGFIRQTRSAVENKQGDSEKMEDVMEESEELKQEEFDSPSRRLSRRLKQKEKELLQQKKTLENESRVSTSDQPTRITNREDISDESTSAISTRSSRRVSISSADDNLLAETSERMTTRSKNRSADDKINSGVKTTDTHNQSSQSSTEKKKHSHNLKPSTPTISLVSRENRRETRTASKSPGHDSKSQSPASSAKTVPKSVTRMATRHMVHEPEHYTPGVGVRSKRFLPPTPAEELLHWQKRVKKLDLPTVVLESVRLPDEKSGLMKTERAKDISQGIDMALKEMEKPESEVVKVKHSKKKKKKQKNKKRRNRQRIPLTAAKEHDHSEDNDLVEHEENSQEKDLVSDLDNVEQELNSESHEVACVKGERSPGQTADKNAERIISSQNKDDHEEAATSEVQEETKGEENAKKEEMDTSGTEEQTIKRTEEQTNIASEEGLQIAGGTSKQDTAEHQSVIKCTPTFAHPVVKAQESPHSPVPSASAAVSHLPEDKSISLRTLAGGRQKMLMYKLVPVLEEESSQLQDCLIPFSGFLIRDGNSGRVLIPQDLVHTLVPTTKCQTAAEAGFVVSSSSPVGLSSNLGTVSGLSVSAIPLSSRSLGQSLAPEVVITSGSTFEWLPTVYSSMKFSERTGLDSAPSPAAWAAPSPVSSLPAVSSLSPWVPQWLSSSAQTTPTVSAGELSPLVSATKSRAPSAMTQSSHLPYRPSQSWNTTPSSVPSSSSLSPFPTSSSTWDSSTSVPMLASAQQQEQSWTRASHQSPQESLWSSSPCVTEAALESWSKEYFPTVTYTNSRLHTQLQQTDSSPQTVLASPGYSMEAGLSQQPPMYASNSNHTGNSGAPYSADVAPHDAQFVDSRQESIIQSYLRQVASNPGGFTQELAGFNLGQQDLAYLENRLRQSPSPNTLFSAVAAYDEASGQVGHDNSLQESINLVHTVNLDMEEGHLESSGNLDLSDLGNNLASSMNMSRDFDGHRAGQYSREEMLNDDGSVGGAGNMDSTPQQGGAAAATSGVLKNDEKKPIRERKSQYQVVIQEDNTKRYRCLLCEKYFSVTTIYRHLRTHDPDYKVTCSLCGKQYTQRQSLIVHWLKAHSDHAPSPDLMKSPKYEESSSSDPLQLSRGNPPGPQLKSPDDGVPKPSGALIRSPGVHIKSPSDLKRQRRNSSTSDHSASVHDVDGISRQEAAHKQVEELRRLKAEKKLAAAQRKMEGHIGGGGVVASGTLLQGTSESAGLSGENMQQTNNTSNISDFAGHHPEQSTLAYEQSASQKTSFSGSLATSGPRLATSEMSSNPENGCTDLGVIKLENVADNQFHFSSPHSFMQTVPQFHADNIPRPISTPVVKSNSNTEPDCSKEMTSVEDGSHLQALKIDGKYACELCSTMLNTKHSYILHMRRHSNVKTKFCSYCDKGFHTMQELRSHERTHTGERPYKCEICHTLFAHSGSYVSHKKSHEKRGELQPFPIVDGQIEYPSTFKKPRLSGGVEGGGEKSRRVRKKKAAVSALETKESEQPTQSQVQGIQQMDVIQRNHPDNMQEHAESTQGQFNTGVSGHWQNLGQQNLASGHFRGNVDSPGVSDGGINSESLRVVSASQSLLLPSEQGNQGFVPSGEEYTSVPGTVPPDYYGGTAGYSHNLVQQKFLSPHADTTSPHSFYKQDKYTPRSSSVDSYPTNSQNLATSLPTSGAAENTLQYASSHSYSNIGQSSRTYYSPQQQPSEYAYSVPPQNEDYPQDDYDESLVQYKNDPSSSEIVKKLLQHYNVPASPFQDSVPIDYSHQIPEESEYSQAAASEYTGLGVGRSTPAPPPYSASINSHQKLYYNSQSSSSGLLRQQPLIAQDQGGLNLVESRQHQLLQSLGVNEGHFGSPYSQGQNQEVYSSDDRYSSSQSNNSTRFASPSLP